MSQVTPVLMDSLQMVEFPYPPLLEHLQNRWQRGLGELHRLQTPWGCPVRISLCHL